MVVLNLDKITPGSAAVTSSKYLLYSGSRNTLPSE